MIQPGPESEVLELFTAEILRSAHDDGSTLSPLLVEEARNLAGALVLLVRPLADTIADTIHAGAPC